MGAGQFASMDESTSISRTATLAGFTAAVATAHGVHLRDLAPMTTLHVHTRNSLYRIIVSAGDAVLAHVARLLLANVRSSDVVGRLGGDEFGVLLAQSDQRVASTKALSLAALIAATPFDWNGSPLGVTVAVGAYGFEQAAEAADILDAADREMYRQKRGAPD